ncbi:hypothetical protein IIA16_06080 [bacterium]|nr:hypothetical protein [bacterium]
MSGGIVVADTCSVILLMAISAPGLPFAAGFGKVLFPAENKSDDELAATPQQEELDRWEREENWSIHDMSHREHLSFGNLPKSLGEGERRACAIALEHGACVLTDDYRAIGTIRQTRALSPLHDRLVTTADLMRGSLQAGKVTKRAVAKWIEHIRSRPHNLQNAQRVEVHGLEDLTL